MAPADAAIVAGFAAVGAVVLWQAWGWPFRAAVFPLMTGTLLLGLALLKLALQARTGAEPPSDTDGAEVLTRAASAERLGAVAWMGGFFVLLWLAGALIAVPAFAVTYLRLVSRQSLAGAVSYGLVMWTFVYGLFDRLLHVPLPAGVMTAPWGGLF